MSFLNVISNMKLKGKLALSMLLAGIIPLLVGSLIINYISSKGMEKQAFNQLESVKSAKKAKVEYYFGQIRDQVLTFSESTMVVDAAKSFRSAFSNLSNELAIDEIDLDSMQSKNRSYYTNEFGQEFAKQNPEQKIDINSLLPSQINTVAAQYQYISNNPQPLGSKDNMDVPVGDNSSYAMIHKKYHPIIRDYLKKFGYYDIFIVEPVSGNIVYSVFKELDFGTSLKSGPYSNTNFAKAFNLALNSNKKDSVHLIDFAPYLPSYNGAASFISSPIYDGGSLVGVLIFQMPVGRINEIMQLHEGMGESGETYLVGPDKLMRSQSRFSEENTLLERKVDTVGANKALNGDSGSEIFTDYRNVEVLSAYAPLKLVDLNWGILAEIDKSEAFAAVYKLQWAILLLTITATALIAFFAIYYSKKLADRVASAKDIAQNISTGNFDNQVMINGKDEVSELMGALDVMQTELIGNINKEKEQALNIMEDMQGERKAIDKMLGRIQFDLDGHIIEANDAFLSVVGYQLDEIKGKHHRMFVDETYASSNDYKLFWEKLNRGEADQGEYERIGKNGKHVWIDAIYSPILDENGKPKSVIKFAKEITEQKNAQKQIQGLIEGAVQGQLDNRMQDLDKFDGFTRSLGEGVNQLLNAFSQPITEAMRVIKAQAEGDLSQKMEGNFQGDFAIMRDSINEANSNLFQLISKIRSASNTISTSATEIVQGNTDLSSRTEQQASALEETASTIEEMTGTVKQNADNAKQANQLAKSARETAEKGGAVVSNAVTAMGEINTSSNKIADIISVIDEIAFQTNLLALNAAVEAARAGEQGRGFAVVASEVRNLAQRSAEAAREIKGLIEDSVNKVEEGSKLVDESGDTLEEIVLSVKKVSDIIAEIAAAGEEQYVGIEQINKAVSEMDQMTQQNAALVEEAAAASQAMSQQSHDLTDAVKVFSDSDTQGTGSVESFHEPDFSSHDRRSADRPWGNQSSVDSEPVDIEPVKFASNSGSDDEWEEF